MPCSLASRARVTSCPRSETLRRRRASSFERPKRPPAIDLMSKTTGHIIRMIGMLIEMLGVWGVYQASNSKTPWVISIPGAGSMPSPGWRCSSA